jgi:hypothetical protein
MVGIVQIEKVGNVNMITLEMKQKFYSKCSLRVQLQVISTKNF